MDDLISRRKLLKEIETWGGCVEALHEYISNMPAAYDPDAVVEQLEEESDYEPIDYDYCDVACTDEQHFIATDKAIEIVRKGGAE